MLRPKLMDSATEEQRLAAFELGICLNQLRWNRTQALVTACTDKIQAVTNALQSLPLLFVKLLPSEDGGNLRESAKEHEKCWRFILFNKELDRQWQSIHWDIFRHGCQLAPDEAPWSDKSALFLKLQNLVPDYAEDLRRNLLDALGDWRDLRALVNLGSKIDQRRHPHEIYFVDFWHVDVEGHPSILWTTTEIGQRRGCNGDLSFVLPGEWPFRPFPSGKFHPDEDDWHLQLCIVWKNALPGFGEPESPVTENANCTEVDEWTERQIGTIKRRICEPPGEQRNDADQLAEDNEYDSLSDTQKNLLQALLEQNAVNSDSLMTLEALVKAALGSDKPDNFKRDANELRKLELTGGKRGPGGGNWLTLKGQRFALKASNRNH